MSGRDEGFLARWSRRKIEARQVPVAGTNAGAPAPVPIAPAPVPSADEATAAPPSAASPDEAAPLPPLESLTPESDFTPFMRPGVDPAVKGRALKALFSDPALYAMDGLDVYIDDYTKPDPLPEGWLAKLNQLASLHGAASPEPETGARPHEPGEGSASAVAPDPPASEPHEVDTSSSPEAQPDSGNREAT